MGGGGCGTEAYPTSGAAFLHEPSVVEEPADRERHAEERDAEVDETEVEDQEAMVISVVPVPNDCPYRVDVGHRRSDHEDREHEGFADVHR